MQTMRAGFERPSATEETSLREAPRLSPRLLAHPLLHRRQRVGGLGAVGAARLGHVRAPAPALAAERRRAKPHEIDRVEARRQIGRHSDDEKVSLSDVF